MLGTLALLMGSACLANPELDRQIDRVARTLSDVQSRGAMRCAPRELAVARSRLEFARLEEEQGFPSRARVHLDIAEENIEAAGVLSAPDQCAGSAD